MIQSNRVGPVIFAHRIARGQLQSVGEVITYRAGADHRTTGRTHARWKRTGTKQLDVEITHLTRCNAVLDNRILAAARPLSGFESVREWKEAIKEMNGGTWPREGHLYHVQAISEVES